MVLGCDISTTIFMLYQSKTAPSQNATGQSVVNNDHKHDDDIIGNPTGKASSCHFEV